jgi:hypothetical protein
MNIKIQDVRKVFDTLVAHIIEAKESEPELPWDYYWDMPIENRYNPDSEPKDEQLNLGQLEDDWTDLSRTADEEYPVGYAFVWFSSILRAIGESANSSANQEKKGKF